MHVVSSPQPTRRPFTTRIAMLSARHAWLTLILWLSLSLGLFVVGQQLGLRTEPGAPTLERLAADNPGYQALIDAGRIDNDSVTLVISHPALTVDDEEYTRVVSALAADLRALTYEDEDGNTQPTFSQLIDYYAIPDPRLAAGLISEDRRTTIISGQVEGTIDVTRPRLEPVEELIDALAEDEPDFAVGYISSAAIDDQIVELINSDLHAAERLTLPITFVILLFAFGSVVASAVPLGLAMTALLGSYGLSTLYSHVVEPINATANQLVALMVLAVGVDYSLFIITRFRSERQRGRDRLEAIEVACSTAGRAVFFSGMVVAISLIGLLVLQDDLLTAMGAVTIFGVLMAVLGSLTFLPAVIALLDHRLEWLRLPFINRAQRGPRENRLVSAAMRFPVITTLLVTGLLLWSASPLLQLQLGSTLNNLDSLPEAMPAVQAYQLIDERLPSSEYDLTFDVVIVSEDTPLSDPDLNAAISNFETELLTYEELNGPVLREQVSDEVLELRVAMDGSPNDSRNHAIVEEVRASLIPDFFAEEDGLRAYVTGTAADTLDEINRYNADLPIVFGVIFAFSYLLLLLVFRSIVIPIKAILLNLLSLGASYGALVLIFQEGWFADLLDVAANGVIQSFVPILMFTILFGLSMDYHLFILSRVKEGVDRGESSDDAVQRGINETAGTITSAAVIMVAVFGVFATLSMPLIKQLGVGLAIAVAVDATIVRSLLLPASMRLLGQWNWYLPRWLHWLPRITIEAEPDDHASHTLLAPSVPRPGTALPLDGVAWMLPSEPEAAIDPLPNLEAGPLRPARIIALRTAAEQALREANWTRAIDILSLLRRYTPADEPTALQLAEAHYRNGNADQAVAQLQALVQHYQRTYQAEQQIRVIHRMTAYAPHESAVQHQLAQTYIALGRPGEAIGALEQVAELHMLYCRSADAGRALQQAAEIAWAGGERERAIALYRRTLRLQPDDLDARARLVTLCLEAGQREEALREQIEAAQICQWQRRGREAVAAWEQVVHIAPEHLPGYYRLARALIEIEQYERAELVYAKLATLEPHNPRLITLQAEMRQLALRRTIGRPNPASPAHPKAG